MKCYFVSIYKSRNVFVTRVLVLIFLIDFSHVHVGGLHASVVVVTVIRRFSKD